MKRARIKICGITRPEDALFCQARGADHLGVIFAAGSPRRITPARASLIRAAVPVASLVGVFVDAPLEEITHAVRESDLDVVQLHGREDPGFCRIVAERTELPVIKAVTARDLASDGAAGAFSSALFLLLDLDKGVNAGPAAVDELWSAAARAGRDGRRIFLAGSLDPGNVRQALEAAAPHGVDVCSGVEREPGVKDHAAVERFIEEVRDAGS